MADEAQGDLLTTEASQTETTSNWHGEENADLVKQKGWSSGDDAVNSYRELEKSYSGRIKMPSPESSADEIRQFYQKTGCPENPEGYEVTAPEGLEAFRDEGIEGAMKQIAYDQGVSKQAFESIVKGYYEKLNSDMQAGREAGEAELKKEYPGEKYDELINTANRFFDSCSEEFCALVKASGLANNPVFIKEFCNKGKQTLSDTLIKGSADGDKPTGDGYTPQYPNSPEMYANGEDEDSVKGRAYHTARGHKY